MIDIIWFLGGLNGYVFFSSAQGLWRVGRAGNGLTQWGSVATMGIAVDDSFIYLSGQYNAAPTLTRVPLGGGPPSTIDSGTGGSLRVVVLGDSVYSNRPDGFGRVPKSGGVFAPIVPSTDNHSSFGVISVGEDVFAVVDHKIYRFPTNLANSQAELFYSPPAGSLILFLTASSKRIFWAEAENGSGSNAGIIKYLAY